MEKLKSALIGFIIGDIIGLPVEFEERANLKENPVVGLREYGTHHQPIGSWSDDTSMTLCTLQSLSKDVNLGYTMKLFEKWLDDNYMTSHGITFDSGITTFNAINNYKKGLPINVCGEDSYYSNGNGSLMRMLPVAFYVRNFEIKTRFKIINEYSSLTHSHSISINSCFFYSELVRLLIIGKSLHEAYTLMCSVFKNNLLYVGGETKHLDVFVRILEGISTLSEEEIKSSGFVIDTLEASLWCLLNSSNYSEAILKAVNLGEDTDTIGAITGSLAGLIYGYDAIPNKWKGVIPHRDMIDELMVNFILKAK